MLSDRTLEKLDRLALVMKDCARGGAGGVRRSKMLGSSAEFSDFREYAPGDDIRRIDWNAYARFDRLFLKLFMEEQEMCLTVVLDASRSMKAKWPFASQLAEALCYLALRGGDKARIAALQNGREVVSGQFSGRASFLSVCGFVDAIEPSGEAAMDELVPRLSLPNRGLCAVISDLMFDGEGERALKSLAFRRQQPALMHVLSARELSPELSGPLRLIDSEGRAPLDLVMDRATLDDYQGALDAFLGRARAAANRLGAGYALLNADEPLEGALMGPLAESGVLRG